MGAGAFAQTKLCCGTLCGFAGIVAVPVPVAIAVAVLAAVVRASVRCPTGMCAMAVAWVVATTDCLRGVVTV